jgi:CRISPR-associated endonuclease Cas2
MILICYDIGNNALRTRIGQYLLKSGLERVNLSVYLGTCNDTAYKHLMLWLNNAMKKAGENDSLLVLPVTQNAVWNMEVLGRNDYDIPMITGDRHTLIL